jgi:hypothetical protein
VTRRWTGLTPASGPTSLPLTYQAAVVDDVTGEFVGWYLPETPEDAPHEVREGLTLRRLTALHGRCPTCGTTVVFGTRSERRRAAALGQATPAGAPHAQHRPGCCGGDVELAAAINRWRNGGPR